MDFHKGAGNRQFEFARQNRKELTAAEGVLWKRLRNGRLDRYKFRRQHPLAGFIADFYCHEARLVIEVDGEVHDSAEQMQYDEERTLALKELGIRVIRFTNEEVLTNIGQVLEEIKKGP
ncbi:endonuclease domain-containing protein, partial [Cesiribacter andamanensis]|uniref:endonuclease domain-containing protein n=1 Tax=Cesiribacter andamanensis TaxID=649507 RepID=UPI000590B8A7